MRNLKEKFKHPAFIFALFLPGILLLALPFFKPGELPNFLLFMGRLHPLILHFPVALIVLALLFEITRCLRFTNISNNVLFIVLLVAAISTLLSIGAGFLLFASGDYAGNLMDQHFWAGAITGFGIFTTVGLFLVYWAMQRYYSIYLAALILSNVAVAYTSHLGGSITHGQDYLTEHLSLILNTEETHESKSEGDMLVYEDMIEPIFEAKCVSCHNSQKAKGDFLMTSYQDIQKGGESDLPSITPRMPEKSELFNRVVLPENHKDHMPPEGKTPLTDKEISLLKFWIEAGAKADLKVQEARKDETVDAIVGDILPALVRYRRKSQLASLKIKVLEQELSQIAQQLNVIIKKDSLRDGNYFSLAMSFPPAPLTNDQFKILHPYAEVFSKVSLVSSGIDDAGLYYIGKMVNLEQLYLQKTRLDGSGLIYLQNLRKLRVLNLSFTAVDDKAALDLLKIPTLEEVYLYRTNTSKEVINALQKNKAGLTIFVHEGPYF